MTIPIARNTSPTLNLTNRLTKLSARSRSRCPLCRWTQSERAGPLPFQLVDTGIKPPFASVTAALQAIPAPSSNCDGPRDQLKTTSAAAIPQNSAQVPSPGIRCQSSLAANSVTAANQMIIALVRIQVSCGYGITRGLTGESEPCLRPLHETVRESVLGHREIPKLTPGLGRRIPPGVLAWRSDKPSLTSALLGSLRDACEVRPTRRLGAGSRNRYWPGHKENE